MIDPPKWAYHYKLTAQSYYFFLICTTPHLFPTVFEWI